MDTWFRYVSISLSLLWVLVGQVLPASAQEVLLDQMVQAGALKLYPVYGDAKTFYYIPDKVAVPRGKDNKPQFSFLKFARNVAGTGEGGVQRGQGGGLVHFLVNFEVDEQTRQQAEAELQSKVAGARIAGPLTFRRGTFALISNFKQEDGDWTTRVLGLGKAPVMEGHKAAVSIRLTAEGATLLWESFKQAASDISVSFEMDIAGYRNPYEAELKADWSKIAKNRTIAAGAKTVWMGFDIQNSMKELREEEAITIETKGASEKLDRIWEIAYNKIADQIFEQTADPTLAATLQDDPNLYSNFDKAAEFNRTERDRIQRENEAERARETQERERLATFLRDAQHLPLLDLLPLGERQSLARDAIPRVSPARIQNAPNFALLAAYRQKSFKKTGFFRLNLKSWTADTLAVRFDENIGGFGKRMLNDPAHFREVNLDDPVYQQREVLVSLDGQDSADFGKFVNFVTVGLRKRHQDGSTTNQELKIDKANFNSALNNFRMIYGYKGDKDRNKWLEFEHRTVWSLYGGVLKDSGWQPTNTYVLPVAPPHRYREIAIEADPEIFRQKGVRLATVTFRSRLFGQEQVQHISLRPTSGGPLAAIIKYAHEPDDLAYQYEVVWRLAGGEQIKSGPKTGSEAVLFADELPRG